MPTIALLLLTALAPAAADDAQADLPAQVRKLVRQLGVGEVAVREAAEKRLIELGPAAMDVLDKVPPQSDAEINTRLARVREALYKQAVEAATQAATVTLKGDALPLSEVFAAIEKQTGNRIADKRADFGQRVEDVKVKIDFDSVPYWQALDAVLDQADMTTYNYSGEAGATAVIARGAEMLPRSERAAYSGIFRFEPTQIEAIRDLRNPAGKALKLYLDVAWEPRTTPIAMALPLSSISVRDGKGKPIAVDGRLGTIEADVNSEMSAADLELPLALPPRDVETIASLEGELTVLVPGRTEMFTFDQLAEAKDTEQKKASATVILQTVRKNGDVYEVRMVLRFDKASNALESHRGWVFGNDAYLLDAKGQRIDHAGYETTRQTKNEVGFSYKFVIDGAIDAYKFVYHTPAAVVQKQIPFRLKDIPLP